MKMQKSQGGAAPSSTIGLMRFFDTEMAGPKISPQFVIVISALIIAVLIAMQLIG